MFENMFNMEEGNSIDILNNLLNNNNITMKTDLNMLQIKELIKIKWFSELHNPKNKEKSGIEILSMVMDYFMELMTSYQRKSRIEIIKGITELKEEEKSLINKIK